MSLFHSSEMGHYPLYVVWDFLIYFVVAFLTLKSCGSWSGENQYHARNSFICFTDGFLFAETLWSSSISWNWCALYCWCSTCPTSKYFQTQLYFNLIYCLQICNNQKTLHNFFFLHQANQWYSSHYRVDRHRICWFHVFGITLVLLNLHLQNQA